MAKWDERDACAITCSSLRRSAPEIEHQLAFELYAHLELANYLSRTSLSDRRR